jgi:uncharacterized protein
MDGVRPKIGRTTESERIVSLDVLRGFAVLGILLMNIQGFSMISAASMNPTAYSDFAGVHRVGWVLSHVLAEQKSLSVFSMLFGAGIVLLTARREAAGLSPGALF